MRTHVHTQVLVRVYLAVLHAAAMHAVFIHAVIHFILPVCMPLHVPPHALLHSVVHAAIRAAIHAVINSCRCAWGYWQVFVHVFLAVHSKSGKDHKLSHPTIGRMYAHSTYVRSERARTHTQRYARMQL